jgi:hypothetical protein
MADSSAMIERHEVRVPGEGQTIVFVADSRDGRLIIRQESEETTGEKANDVCSIALSNPDELRAFFHGLRRILASLGHRVDVPAAAETPHRAPARALAPQKVTAQGSEDREAVVAQARQRNPQAFAPWTRAEEDEIRRRHASGESVQSIARAHRRSPRAIELRLQRLGVLPPE